MAALLALVLLAQDAPRQDRATDWWVNRMKDRLKLTDEQVAQVREIYAKDAEERGKLDEARTAKVAGLLNEEQKKQYEEMRRGFGGGGGGQRFNFQGGGPGGGGGFGRPGQFQMEDLKRELALTDDQVQKVQPILEEFNQSIQKRAEELRQGGLQGFNWLEEVQKFPDAVKQVAEKVKAHLTEEQKAKLDGMVERMTGWTRFLQGGGLGGGFFGGGGGPRRPSVEDKVRRTMDALKVEKEDERAAIADLVAKVVKAQYDLEDYQKAAREKLAEAAKNRELSDPAIEDRLNEVQEERRKREKELAGLQKQLAEVVTNRQEIELIVQGILK
jgi:hypothetical protein